MQTVQNASVAKDIKVDVTVTDFKDNVLPHESMIFKSRINRRKYQGLIDLNGRVSVRLPAGDQYDLFILGFADSTIYDVMNVPDPGPKASCKLPFVLTFQFAPAKTFVLNDRNFKAGEATLEPVSYTLLDELVSYLVRKSDERMELGGHIDNVGTKAANLALSTERALSVINYSISKGIEPSRLEAKGYGMRGPVQKNKTAEGRAQNRRTGVEVLE